MVALGYGKFVRADRIFGLVPLEAPLVASRSEAAIARDMAEALGHLSARGGRRDGEPPGQDPLF